MKKIVGLDLGSASIGWAVVREAENENEQSSIVKTGVRIIPLDNFVSSDGGTESKDPLKDFRSGRGISTNAARTQKRGARRTLQRYKLRRAHLLKLLRHHHLIDADTPLAETGSQSTHTLWKLRAEAAEKPVALPDFARILLAINKKRGYKSNRKAKDEGEGKAIDGMEVAHMLHRENLTPGQYALKRLQAGKKYLPDFYPSDLKAELDKIWHEQQKHYPETLTDTLKAQLEGKNKSQTWKICEKPLGIAGIKRETKGLRQKMENYQWRADALTRRLHPEHLAIVLQEINGELGKTSGYLGEISDRSKERYFNGETIGQYHYRQLRNNPHYRIKQQVFYRKDYEDEFDKLWEVQAPHHPALTDELKAEIKDVVIFYQRRLKSQKGLLAICELEGKEREVLVNGQRKKKLTGSRVVPKSSPLFQAFKIRQTLNNLKLEDKTGRAYKIAEIDEDGEIRNRLFDELNTKGKLSAADVKKLAPAELHSLKIVNFKELEGNHTNEALYKAYERILTKAGYDLALARMRAPQVRETVGAILESLGIDQKILHFEAELTGEAFQQQPAYRLWHLLYSYEGDDSPSGNDRLIALLHKQFGFRPELGAELAGLTFADDYGNLSTTAIRKLMPFLQAGHDYAEAALLAGYRHSGWSTKAENKDRPLDDRLELLPAKSLRNPLVEKVLNQMAHLINDLIAIYGRPDEVRIELARELKNSAQERDRISKNISNATKAHEEITKKLKAEFAPFNQGARVTRNDIIRYKLWLETGGISLYTGQPIQGSELFTRKYDIEHILPKSVLFDDSFSNKTLCERSWNSEKGNDTAYDYLKKQTERAGLRAVPEPRGNAVERR